MDDNSESDGEQYEAAGGGDVPLEDNDTDEEEQQFDIALAASHSYMGPGLVAVSGRSVLEAGWEGRVPVVAHHGAVFPGETVPMLLPNAHDAAVLSRAIKQDKLFGLLCPDESGTLVSGYGVLCEVFEAGLGSGLSAGLGAARGAEPEREPPAALSFKARATHRFRFLNMPKHSVPIHLYARMRCVEVVVLPEVSPAAPLARVRLAALDSLRHSSPALDRRLRGMDAAVTPWPLFVYEIFDYARMRQVIKDYFKTIMLDKLPEDPVSLSFWVASNLALSARDRLALFVVDNALLRLHMEVRFISRKSVLCCSSCMGEIARREHIFAMSSEGVHSNYTNLGGYMHDIVTVSRAVNTELNGSPSAEYSWFPGYTWTIALCQSCMAHVGWRFDALKRNLRPQQFYGLCRNYVQPRTDPDPPDRHT
ncbi:protein cereblon isoform X2 [Manduca sexta]|uniref:protein cereblon isoform X2 n=1 Tax=Manduca sexta TaxID=7130 RepID=UPI001182D10E|nr:protein cereblon isoform X2 [Manduca sexta]